MLTWNKNTDGELISSLLVEIITSQKCLTEMAGFRDFDWLYGANSDCPQQSKQFK